MRYHGTRKIPITKFQISSILETNNSNFTSPLEAVLELASRPSTVRQTHGSGRTARSGQAVEPRTDLRPQSQETQR